MPKRQQNRTTDTDTQQCSQAPNAKKAKKTTCATLPGKPLKLSYRELMRIHQEKIKNISVFAGFLHHQLFRVRYIQTCSPSLPTSPAADEADHHPQPRQQHGHPLSVYEEFYSVTELPNCSDVIPYDQVDCKWLDYDSLSWEDKAQWDKIENNFQITFNLKLTSKSTEWEEISTEQFMDAEWDGDMKSSYRHMQSAFTFGMCDSRAHDGLSRFLEEALRMANLKADSDVLTCGADPYDPNTCRIFKEDGKFHQTEIATPATKRAVETSSTGSWSESLESASSCRSTKHTDLCVIHYLQDEQKPIKHLLDVVANSGLNICPKHQDMILKKLTGVLFGQDDAFGLLINARFARIYRLKKNLHPSDRELGEINFKYKEYCFSKPDEDEQHKYDFIQLFRSDALLQLFKDIMIIFLYKRDF